MGIRMWVTGGGAVILAAAAPVMAGYTPIGSSGEPNLHAVFTSAYGTLSVANIGALSSASSFTAGPAGPLQYTFTRIHDFGMANDNTPTDLHSPYGGTTTDQRFADGLADVRFLVKYAGNNNRLGFSNTSNASLVDGDVSDILGSTIGSSAQVTLSSNFQLTLKINSQSNNYWGSNTDTGSNDHFVTWQVVGQGRTFWVVGVEDLNLGDADYNDWVGEFSVIPLPPAAWAGLSTLAGIGLLGAARRRRLLV